MRADGGERIGGDLADLAPGHAQLVAERRVVDAVAAREVAHRAAQIVLALEAAQPPIDVLVEFVLRLGGIAIVAAVLPVHHQRDAAVLRDRGFQREPPQFAGAVGKAGRNVDRERHVVFLQDRKRVAQIVAIAVVEREADEAAAEILLLEPAVHFVERDDIDVRAAQAADHVLEKFGRDLQQPVRLKRIRARRAHVMQGQDRADAAQQRTQQPVGAGEIQRLHSGAENDLLQSSHNACLACRIRRRRPSRSRVERRRRAGEHRDVAEARSA